MISNCNNIFMERLSKSDIWAEELEMQNQAHNVNYSQPNLRLEDNISYDMNKEAETLVVKIRSQEIYHSKLKYILHERLKTLKLEDFTEKSTLSFIELVCMFEKVDQIEFEYQQDTDPFQDEELLQSAMDFCLSLKNPLCTEYLLDRLREEKIEPVVGIKALSEVVQGIPSLQDLSESDNSNTKEPMTFSRAKDAYSDNDSVRLEESDECIKTILTN